MRKGSDMQPHRIGIIAGSGPEAGIDMWAKVLQEHRLLLGDAYRGDIDAPEVTVISLPELGYSMDLEHEEERVWRALVSAATRISEQVDVYVIACNTLNYFADRLRKLHLPAELLTPAAAAAAELRSRRARSAALIGSRQTMDLEGLSSYGELSDVVRVEIPADADRVHGLIESIKLAGGSTPAVEAEFAAIRADLKSDLVLLACTELPLLHGSAAQESQGAIDVSRLLARAVVRWAPGGETVTAPGGFRLAVVYTGGTFGMVETVRGLAPSPDLHGHLRGLLERTSPDLLGSWAYVGTPVAIDSAEASYRVFADLSDTIRETITNDGADAVIVIHGTDTMAYGAAYTAFALADISVPIVFTGSQLPLNSTGSDAPANFALALQYAVAASQSGDAAVMIAFGSRVTPAVRAQKRSTHRADGFAATRELAAGAAGLQKGLAAALGSASDKQQPDVSLVKVSPSLSEDETAAAVGSADAGIVVECYGAGTAPVNTAEMRVALASARERDLVVLAITQCDDGSVELGRYSVGHELSDLGVLGGGDMTPEAALGKLSALSRAGYRGDALRAMMSTNLLGEVSFEE